MKKKLLISMLVGISLLGTTVPSILLTSCSNSSNKVEFNYDNNKKIASINSTFFNNDNIFYNFQNLKNNNYQDYINLLANFKPSLFSTSDKFDIDKISVESNTIVIPVINSNNVLEVRINFPSIDLLSLNIPISNTFQIQANSVFFNMSTEEICQLPSNQIIQTISQYSNSNIPLSAYINQDYIYIDDTSITYYIFLPNSKIPFGKLIISNNRLVVNSPNPSIPIKNLNIKNDWESIVNWNTPTIAGNTYKYIENLLDNNLIPSQPFTISYNSAANSEIVKKYFDSKIWDDVQHNLIQDFYYGFKVMLSNLLSAWSINNVLNFDVFCGNNLEINNNLLNGNIAIQFKNPTKTTQLLDKENFYLNIDIPSIQVKSNSNISLVINFNNSRINPYLSLCSDIDNTAYLTTCLSNIDMKIYVDNDLIYSYSDNNFLNIVPNSLSISAIIKNVKDGSNILECNSILESSIQKINANNLRDLNKNYVQNKLDVFQNILKSTQNILLLSAQNPSIYDFLTSLNSDLYNIIYSLTGNDSLAKIVANLFSNQNVSTFLYYNLENFINVINDLIPNSTAKISLINLLTDIKNSNKTPTDMINWVSSLSSLVPMLKRVLQSQLGWLIKIIEPLIYNIAENPNIFDCIFSLLPSIFNTMASDPDVNDDKIKNIGKSLLLYFSNLIEFANQNDPDCIHSPIPSDKYKDIHVLDFIVNEFTDGNNNSILNILLAIVGNNNETINLIGKIINAINFKMDCKVRTSILSSSIIFGNKYNYENMNLYDLIKWIINSFFLDVKLENGETTDLYSAISQNLEYSYSENNFTFDNNTNYINQDCDWTFKLKQKIVINTLPLSALISKENIILDLSSLGLENLESTINKLIDGAIPVNLVISPKNIIKSNFYAENSILEPIVINNNINWQYFTTNTIDVDLSYILNESNIKSTPQEKCYGGSFSTLKLLLSLIMSTNAITNKICYMNTNSSMFGQINNYNNDSYISELYINQLENDEDLVVKFKKWLDIKTNYYLDNNKYIINYDSLKKFISDNFMFSNIFNNNNNFATYQATITSANFKLISNTNSFTLNILFSAPTLIIKPDNSCYLSNSYTLTVNL